MARGGIRDVLDLCLYMLVDLYVYFKYLMVLIVLVVSSVYSIIMHI